MPGTISARTSAEEVQQQDARADADGIPELRTDRRAASVVGGKDNVCARLHGRCDRCKAYRWPRRPAGTATAPAARRRCRRADRPPSPASHADRAADAPPRSWHVHSRRKQTADHATLRTSTPRKTRSSSWPRARKSGESRPVMCRFDAQPRAVQRMTRSPKSFACRFRWTHSRWRQERLCDVPKCLELFAGCRMGCQSGPARFIE